MNDAERPYGVVYEEKDLKRFAINPPPSDGRCECCGKHLNDLKPFGKAGDPLVGDFEGALLVKNFRPMAPFDRALENTWERFFGNCETDADYQKARRIYVEKYGEEAATDLELYAEARGCVSKSWECRDCAVLNSDCEYFLKRAAMLSKI